MVGATQAVCTYTQNHHFPSGNYSLFFILDSHLAVFTMENSVPLKNPYSVFYLEVGIVWVALSQIFHEHASISPLVAPFGWILVKLTYRILKALLEEQPW